MPGLLEEGIGEFNTGRWYEAHESWEDLWRETEGEARLFYQGLVQIAVGCHHLTCGNFRGGKRVLERGLRKLEAFPPSYRGIDNRRLIEEVASALEKASPEGIRIRLAKSDG